MYINIKKLQINHFDRLVELCNSNTALGTQTRKTLIDFNQLGFFICAFVYKTATQFTAYT